MSFDEVVARVCDEYRVTQDKLLGDERYDRRITFARHLVWVLWKRLGMTYREISSRFNVREYSVWKTVQRMEEQHRHLVDGALDPDWSVCPPADHSESFALVWQAWPRKINQKRALDYWQRKLRPSESLAAQILAAIRAQASWLMRDGGKFCPYFINWLKGERWNDEVPVRSSRGLIPREQWTGGVHEVRL